MKLLLLLVIATSMVAFGQNLPVTVHAGTYVGYIGDEFTFTASGPVLWIQNGYPVITDPVFKIRFSLAGEQCIAFLTDGLLKPICVYVFGERFPQIAYNLMYGGAHVFYATLSWIGPEGEGEVTVRDPLTGEEKSFASTSGGRGIATWIAEGWDYLFILWQKLPNGQRTYVTEKWVVSPRTLTCSPEKQAILAGTSARVTAAGGDGTTFMWDAKAGDPSRGTGAEFNTVYDGRFAGMEWTIFVYNKVGQSATCDVFVLPRR